ncbi:MAG: ABC transporter substrate-binding protein, partial [candidate division NC10 bacterium]
LVIGLLLLSMKVIDTRPVLKVAVEASNPPIAFEDDAGKIAGLDIDIIQAVGRDMGYRVSIRPTAFSHLFLSVEKGLTDVAVGELTVTEERKRIVAFSESYHQSGLALLVPPNSPARTLEDLRGQSIGVKAQSTGETYLNQRPGHVIRRLDASPDLAALFKSGVLNAVVFDRPILEKWLAQNICTGRIIDMDQQDTYAIAYRKDAAVLGKNLNKAIAALRKSGELEKIMKKWLEQPERPLS